MKININNFWWVILKIFVILFLNSSIFFLLLSKCINVHTADFGNVSFWNAITIKVFDYHLYHWYNDFIVYICIIIGIILTIMFLKIIYKEKKEDKRSEKTNDLIKKVFGKEK